MHVVNNTVQQKEHSSQPHKTCKHVQRGPSGIQGSIKLITDQ